MAGVLVALPDISFLWLVAVIVLLGAIAEVLAYGRKRGFMKKEQRLCFNCFVLFRGSRCPKCSRW